MGVPIIRNPRLANFTWSFPGTRMQAIIEAALLTLLMVVAASTKMRALGKFGRRFLRRRTVVTWFRHIDLRKLRPHQTRNKVCISPKFSAENAKYLGPTDKNVFSHFLVLSCVRRLLPGMATGSVCGMYYCPRARRESKWQADGSRGRHRCGCALKPEVVANSFVLKFSPRIDWWAECMQPLALRA